ncbi:MAG TPA: PDZ domain-containing protein [Thermoanaerobacterales bacterium]|nr:PDZ domain-containing protein [Thermoanaerobacterales bacterium]
MKLLNRKKAITVIVIILILCTANIYIAKNYIIMMPGIAKNLRETINIYENDNFEDEKGAFLLITVSTRSANLPLVVYSLLNPYAKIHNKTNIIPNYFDKNEYQNYTRELMEESQIVAKAVALSKAGYSVEIQCQGVKVLKVLNESNGYGKIKDGDIILSIDRKEISKTSELLDEVNKKKKGEIVELILMRDAKEEHISVKVVESSNNNEKAGLGLYVKDYLNVDLPFQVEIEIGEIGGPSAGIMFALEIYNRLTKADLTLGKIVAGTGTLSFDGEIGEIGGVEQKVITAHKNGAEIFFIPIGNYKDAKPVAEKYGITLVPIKTFDDALKYLKDRQLYSYRVIEKIPPFLSHIGVLISNAVNEE